MKKFDLEKALAGEPVILKNGCKAFIKFQKPSHYNFAPSSALGGYWINNKNIAITENWRIDGVHYDDSNLDIVGMYEEPRPTVTLTLPCPLKTVKDGQRVYFLNQGNFLSPIGSIIFNEERICDCQLFKNGGLFANKQDAQSWLDAMRDSRR